MRWTPRALIPVAVGFFIILSAAVAQAFPATTPDNTGMVDFPGAGGSSNAVAVRTIAQFGHQRLGGRQVHRDRRRQRQQGPGCREPGGVQLHDRPGRRGRPHPLGHAQRRVLAEIYDSSVGPDGNLYFAGNFDAVDGQTRHNVAAVNATTGALVTRSPRAPASANAVLATASAIYVGHGQAALVPAERHAHAGLHGSHRHHRREPARATPRSRSSATSSCRAARWWRPASATA